MTFGSRISLYFFVILLVVNLVQWRAYGLTTATTHNPALTLKLPINTSSQSRIMNSNSTNRSITTQPPKMTTTPVSNQVENIVVGAVISAASLFIVSSLLDIKRNRETRPVLQIDQNENPYVLGTGIECLETRFTV